MEGEIMNQRVGRSSIRLAQQVCVIAGAAIVGKKEGEGPLGALFDMVGEDDLFGCKTWEEAESNLQKDAVYMVMEKAGWKAEDVSYLFAGDLLGQCIATSFGISAYNIPLFGVYGACSTCGEALTLGAVMAAGGYAEHVVCVTSSHFASAEKEFRFPLDYGNQRPLSASWTVTGSGAFALGLNQKCRAHITGMTPGRIVDYGLKDSMNMGAAMAMAAVDTILQNFRDYEVDQTYYDKIITGDLGSVGQNILFDFMDKAGHDVKGIHMDCGMTIFDSAVQDTHSGGSGCGCSAVTLCGYILPKLRSGEWKRVLFVPTGALLSQISFNEGQNVPGIAHAVMLEHIGA